MLKIKEMKKYIYLLLSLLLSFPVFAQVGMWNPKPQGALDINRKDTKNNMGLVLPLIDKIDPDSIDGAFYPAVTTPTGKFKIVTETVTEDGETIVTNYEVPEEDVPEGTVVFDLGMQCVRVKQSADVRDWSGCLVDKTLAEEEIDYNLYGGVNFRLKKASAGYNFTVAIGTDDDAVYTTGYGGAYRTGKGNTGTAKWGMILKGPAVDVSGAFYHGLALLADGSVWVWGANNQGRTGLGVRSGYTRTPTKIAMPDNINVVQVVAGYENSWFLTDEGEVYACGNNARGMNGNGLTSGYVMTPTKVNLPSDVKIKKLSSGYVTIAAITTEGRVYVWGNNHYGTTALGTTSGYTTIPTLVTALSSYVIKDVAMGLSCLGLTEDGKVLGWGYRYGIAVASPTYVTTPVLLTSFVPEEGEVATSVASVRNYGSYGTMIVTNKSVYAAGNNSYRRLGIVNPETGAELGNSNSTYTQIQDNTIFNGTTFTEVSMGINHTIITTENTDESLNNLTYGAGRNQDYALGNGARAYQRIFTTVKK